MMRKRIHRRKIRKDERGVVGIGTLIVFIAMVLVAAIAAAVIINTAARLQQRAETVTSDTVHDLGIGVMVVNVIAHVGMKPGGDRQIDNLFFYIELNPGAESLNLTNVMAFFRIGNDNIGNLRFADSTEITGTPENMYYYVYDQDATVTDLNDEQLGGIDPNNGYVVDLTGTPPIYHPIIDQSALLIVRIAGGASGTGFWMPPGTTASIKFMPSGGGSIGIKEFRAPGSYDQNTWITIE